MARPSTTVEMTDGEQQITVRIQKMNPLEAEDFLERLLAALVKAGFKLPARLVGGDPSVLGEEIAKNAEGYLVQLKDLQFEEVAYLRQQIFKNCWLIVPDPKSGRTVELALSDNNVNNNIQEVSTIFKLRLEVLKYNFSFLADALAAVGQSVRAQSAMQNTQTSAPSSGRFSVTESDSTSSGMSTPMRKHATS